MIEPLLLKIQVGNSDRIESIHHLLDYSAAQALPTFDPLEVGEKVNELVAVVNVLTARREAIGTLHDFARQHVVGNATSDHAVTDEVIAAVMLLEEEF